MRKPHLFRHPYDLPFAAISDTVLMTGCPAVIDRCHRTAPVHYTLLHAVGLQCECIHNRQQSISSADVKQVRKQQQAARERVARIGGARVTPVAASLLLPDPSGSPYSLHSLLSPQIEAALIFLPESLISTLEQPGGPSGSKVLPLSAPSDSTSRPPAPHGRAPSTALKAAQGPQQQGKGSSSSAHIIAKGDVNQIETTHKACGLEVPCHCQQQGRQGLCPPTPTAQGRGGRARGALIGLVLGCMIFLC